MSFAIQKAASQTLFTVSSYVIRKTCQVDIIDTDSTRNPRLHGTGLKSPVWLFFLGRTTGMKKWVLTGNGCEIAFPRLDSILTFIAESAVALPWQRLVEVILIPRLTASFETENVAGA